MAQNDIPPRRNLPDAAEPWGRFIESERTELWKAVSASDQARGNSNRSFNGALGVLQNQLNSLAAQQEQLLNQQEQLLNQQEHLLNQQEFLLNQQVSLVSTKTDVHQTDTSGTGEWVTQSYDETYDSTINFTTSSTGVVDIECTASLLVNNGSDLAWAGAGQSYEILSGGSQVVTETGNTTMLQAMNAGAIWGHFSRTKRFSLSANTSYTLRSRRRIKMPVSPNTAWYGFYGFAITITKVGM